MEEAAVACRFSSGCDVRYTCNMKKKTFTSFGQPTSLIMSCISIAQDVGKHDSSVYKKDREQLLILYSVKVDLATVRDASIDSENHP